MSGSEGSGGSPAVAVDLRALVPEATGIGVYTRSMLLALARPDQAHPDRARGDRATYLGLAHRPPRGREELEAAGIRVETQPAPLGVLWQQLRLPKRLAAGDVDLLWSPLMTLPLRSPVPGVVTVHDLTALLFPEAHTLKVRWSILPFLQRSLEAARRVVTDSAATAEDLRFHFPETAPKIRVVSAGVDPEFAPAGPEKIRTIRNELGLPDGYLLYVGTLEPRKNVGALLTAWEGLRAESADTPSLVLAGGYGWHSKKLLARIRALEPQGLIHLGRVDRRRLVSLFQAATIFVYPSLYEGFGLPPLEAMACRVPVIASGLSSLPEVVADAGILVDPPDAHALAQALRSLLADPPRAADLAERGRERASRFSWERSARALEEIFAEALE